MYGSLELRGLNASSMGAPYPTFVAFQNGKQNLQFVEYLVSLGERRHVLSGDVSVGER